MATAGLHIFTGDRAAICGENKALYRVYSFSVFYKDRNIFTRSQIYITQVYAFQSLPNEWFTRSTAYLSLPVSYNDRNIFTPFKVYLTKVYAFQSLPLKRKKGFKKGLIKV